MLAAHAFQQRKKSTYAECYRRASKTLSIDPVAYLRNLSMPEQRSGSSVHERSHTLLSNTGRNRDCLSFCIVCMTASSSSTSTCVRASTSASWAVDCVRCAWKIHALLRSPSMLASSIMHWTNIQQMDLIRIGVAMTCQEWQGSRSWTVNQQDRTSSFNHIVEVSPNLCNGGKVAIRFSNCFMHQLGLVFWVRTNDARQLRLPHQKNLTLRRV
jgi:hypothetical protein